MEKNTSLSRLFPSNFVCGFIKNHENIKFISCNTKKYPSEDEKDFEVWTILSSAIFGKKHKGPQESLPQDLIQNVTTLLYQSLEEALVLPKGSFLTKTILESRLQLWGAAVPLNTWKSS